MTRRPTPMHRLVAEGVDNAWRGRFISVAVGAVVAAVTFVSGWLDASAVGSAMEEESAFRGAGGYIVRIAPASSGSTDAVELLRRSDCERLAGSDLVEAAGSTSIGVDTPLVAQPAESLSLFSVSPGFLAVVASLRSGGTLDAIPTDGIVVAADRAAALKLVDGEQMAVGDLAPATVAVEPLATLAPGFGSAAMTVVPPVGEATTCYVAVAPASIARAPSLRAVFGRDDLSVERVLAGADLVEPAHEQLTSRRSRHSTWLGGLIVFGSWLAVVWIKRSDRALYRALGVTPNDLRLVLASEGLAIVAIGAAVGVITAVVVSSTTVGAVAASVGWWSSVAALAAASAGIIGASLLARPGNLLEHLKDR